MTTFSFHDSYAFQTLAGERREIAVHQDWVRVDGVALIVRASTRIAKRLPSENGSR
jgi:hypothetical protein